MEELGKMDVAVGHVSLPRPSLEVEFDAAWRMDNNAGMAKDENEARGASRRSSLMSRPLKPPLHAKGTLDDQRYWRVHEACASDVLGANGTVGHCGTRSHPAASASTRE